jgi:hypothetical protein
MLAVLATVAISMSPMTTSSSRTDIRPPLALDEAVPLVCLRFLAQRTGAPRVEEF